MQPPQPGFYPATCWSAAEYLATRPPRRGGSETLHHLFTQCRLLRRIGRLFLVTRPPPTERKHAARDTSTDKRSRPRVILMVRRSSFGIAEHRCPPGLTHLSHDGPQECTSWCPVYWKGGGLVPVVRCASSFLCDIDALLTRACDSYKICAASTSAFDSLSASQSLLPWGKQEGEAADAVENSSSKQLVQRYREIGAPAQSACSGAAPVFRPGPAALGRGAAAYVVQDRSPAAVGRPLRRTSAGHRRCRLLRRRLTASPSSSQVVHRHGEIAVTVSYFAVSRLSLILGRCVAKAPPPPESEMC
ncbi:hypothetical protein HPB51_002385 [Rhipicephalus microplus]|uniref:Uncharacterized protein n=1 Tax=Rhipicephalus microplus TaxID=6941 RepID=A0A9J6DS80_RHIMP|nr:hypothetical protein HPB51_002385 [Rhipicephalus microplus]